MIIEYKTPAGNSGDPELPSHWTGINYGQSDDERAAAVMSNITRDVHDLFRADNDSLRGDARAVGGVGDVEYAKGPVNTSAARHPVNRNFPAHWTGITYGQSSEERQAALRSNIAIDNDLKHRGIDPATGKPDLRRQTGVRMTPQEALEIAARLRHH